MADDRYLKEISNELRYIERSKASSWKWIVIISAGVFIGNLSSFGLERAVLYWELTQVATTATKAMKNSTKQMEQSFKESSAQFKAYTAKQQKINAEKAKQRKYQRQQKQAGLRQAQETCNFWSKQLTKENTSLNRSYRDQACKKVNEFR